MSREAFEEMRQRSMEVLGSLAPPRLGLVSSYDPSTFAAKVRIMPEDRETGFMPILGLGVGRSMGIYVAPDIGDQVLVVFQEAHPDCGMVIGGLPSDEDRPPTLQAGEATIRTTGGAQITMTADGVVTCVAPGGFRVQGTIEATGEITALTSSAPAMLSVLRDAYKAHRHVETGSTTQLSDHIAV